MGGPPNVEAAASFGERAVAGKLATPDVAVSAFEVVTEPEVSDHRALLLEVG